MENPQLVAYYSFTNPCRCCHSLHALCFRSYMCCCLCSGFISVHFILKVCSQWYVYTLASWEHTFSMKYTLPFFCCAILRPCNICCYFIFTVLVSTDVFFENLGIRTSTISLYNLCFHVHATIDYKVFTL